MNIVFISLYNDTTNISDKPQHNVIFHNVII